jgi:osmoprotectant transport system permease protein
VVEGGARVTDVLPEIAAYLSDPATYQGRFALQHLAWQHVYYSVVAMLLATAIALPLGLWIGHRGKGEFVVVSITNSGRAVPDFGIILLAVLLLGLGVVPVIITLAALAIPPVLINTYVGVRQVDADVRDAALGVGMTGRQLLGQVEFPIALPLIMAGVRTAAVQVVATATLAGAIGGGGFGRIIFDAYAVGFIRHRERVVVACIAVAALALVAEYGLGAIQQRLTPGGTPRDRRDGPRRQSFATESS